MGKQNNAKGNTIVAEGFDPFNGKVVLCKDAIGHWIENNRSGHVSEYLKGNKGKAVTVKEAMEAFNAECGNAHFSSPIHP